MTRKDVVILAAGKGTRLAPLTDAMPKALVPVLGKPILAYALEALAADALAGRCSVSVVVGHMGAQIADYTRENFAFVRPIWNHDFAQTNNMFSLYLGLSGVAPTSSVVFMNGDCVYHDTILQSALAQAGPAIFCDPTMAYNAESMKIRVSDGVVQGIAKTVPEEDAYAVSCDLYALDPGAAAELRGIAYDHIARGDLNSWSEVALNSAMENKCIAFHPASTHGKFWYEIDNHADLSAASERVAGAGGK